MRGRRAAWVAVTLSVWLPGTGQHYLDQVEKGRRMLASYFAAAVPAWALALAVDPALVFVGVPPAIVVWVWSQRDLRRTLWMGWWPFIPPRDRAVEAVTGRDVAEVQEQFASSPERPC